MILPMAIMGMINSMAVTVTTSFMVDRVTIPYLIVVEMINYLEIEETTYFIAEAGKMNSPEAEVPMYL